MPMPLGLINVAVGSDDASFPSDVADVIFLIIVDVAIQFILRNFLLLNLLLTNLHFWCLYSLSQNKFRKHSFMKGSYISLESLLIAINFWEIASRSDHLFLCDLF